VSDLTSSRTLLCANVRLWPVLEIKSSSTN